MVGFHHVVGAHLVQVGVLQAGKCLLAAVFACGRGTHGHRGHFVLALDTDGLVGIAHGSIDFRRQGAGQDGCLHHDGALAQLVDTLRRGCKALNNVVDEGTQFCRTGIVFFSDLVLHHLAETAHQFLQVVWVAVDDGVIPVNAGILPVNDSPDDAAVYLAFIKNPVKGHRRNGSEVRSLNLLDFADDSRVVVLTANKQFSTFAQVNNIRTCQHKLFSDGLRRLGLLARSLCLCGRLFGHDFLRIWG